jgi:hypothetical protein
MTSPYSYGLKDDKAETMVECDTCESFFEASHMIDGYCMQCGTCIDCKTYVTDCLCFSKKDKGDISKYIEESWEYSNLNYPTGGWNSL